MAKKLLSSRSERVKSVDFHPTEPWILASLYNGQVNIWNYNTQTIVKTFEICDAPVRVAKWIARKNWLISGSDDMSLRVFNYNTFEKVQAIEAHTDYIRSIAVHPSKPFVLSSSDDMSIKLWDWEKGWKNTMTFESHTHYVMMIVINPKDSNTFASASLDRTIKVWNFGSTTPNYTLEGHEKGVNCIDYYHGGDKPYLISGADDKNVKIWDYQNKSCVQTLTGHSNNISSVCFHTELPIIISASEDGTIRVWHCNTYRLENTLNYGMERAWCLAFLKGTNLLGFGFDEGAVVIKVGKEEPSISMDPTGKIIWAKHFEIQTTNVKTSIDDNYKDGERLNLPVKELGNSEIYPQSLQHSPNGRFVVVCGDGEYIIYTSLAWRNKSYGSALEFVWASDSNIFAIRESSSKIKICKAFKEHAVIKTSFSAEGIFGGNLIGIKSSSFICFYDWETSTLLRRVDVVCRNVFWSENGSFLCIVSDESFYILKYEKDAVQETLESGEEPPDDGFENTFTFVSEVNERYEKACTEMMSSSVRTACWVGDCFIYTNSLNRLNYIIGKEITTISHFDNPLYILGFISKDSRVYLADKDLNVSSYFVSLSVVEYQTAVLSGNWDKAGQLLSSIPADQINKIARFLDSLGYKEEALKISTDDEHKFELAIHLKNIELALEIAKASESEHKSKQIADLSLSSYRFDLADEAMWKAKDYPGLLLLYHATANGKGLRKLAQETSNTHSSRCILIAGTLKKFNISFSSYFILREVDNCIEVLLENGRFAEAALFARTYKPSQLTKITAIWKANVPKKVANLILDVENQIDKFPGFEASLKAEQWTQQLQGWNSLHSEQYMSLFQEDLITGAKNNQFPNAHAPQVSFTRKLKEDETMTVHSYDGVSDTHSLEVNTTGTGSVHAQDLDLEVDEISLDNLEIDEQELENMLN